MQRLLEAGGIVAPKYGPRMQPRADRADLTEGQRPPTPMNGQMDGDSLLAFVRFHAWANDRILTTAAGLSDEELRGPALLDHGSAFETLRHLVDVDWSWREVCIGNDVGQTYVWDHGFVLDDLAAIHAFCLEEDIRLRSYVESLDQAGLNEPLA